MVKFLLCLLMLSASCYCGDEDSSRYQDMPFFSALKEAKGKDKGEYKHSIPKIDFIYTIARKKCRRYQDYEFRFSKYNVYPYRFTSVSPNSISADTMYRTCLHGRRGYRRIEAKKMAAKKKKFELVKKKMKDYGAGYIHRHMSLKQLAFALSHLSVIKDAFDSGYQTIWIMDAGTKLRCDPSILSSYIERADKEIPDWNLIYTDYSERDDMDMIKTIGHFYWRPDVNFKDPDDYLSRQSYQDDEENDDYYKTYDKCSTSMCRRSFEESSFEIDEICDDHKNDKDKDDNDSNSTTSRMSYEVWVTPAIPTAMPDSQPPYNTKFSSSGLLKGTHSYILNRKGMQIILDYYAENKIFIPYSQEVQIIPGINPYVVPSPVTKNTNKF